MKVLHRGRSRSVLGMCEEQQGETINSSGAARKLGRV